MQNLQKFLFRWGPALVWAGVIFTFSSLPIPSASEIYWKDFIVKKSAHIVEYAVLSALVYRALKDAGFNKKRAGLYAVGFSVFYAFTDEFHQSFTPGRKPSMGDVLFDTIGASTALLTIWRLLPNLSNKHKNWVTKLGLL